MKSSATGMLPIPTTNCRTAELSTDRRCDASRLLQDRAEVPVISILRELDKAEYEVSVKLNKDLVGFVSEMVKSTQKTWLRVR